MTRTENDNNWNENPGVVVLDRNAPLLTARSFWERTHSQDGFRTLHYYQGLFYEYTGICYEPLELSELRRRLYKFLDDAVVQGEIRGKKVELPFNPTRSAVDGVLDALKAEAHVRKNWASQFWIEESVGLPVASELLVCLNGLLHLASRRLSPLTPKFFSTGALPVAFSPQAPKPKRWLNFLSELWPDDQPCVDALQEWFGYLLTPDTRQQKILLAVGPRRSGKGTIARVLKALIGDQNYCGPTLSQLWAEFGMATLIGKSLAVISDARLGGSKSTAEIAERLLSTSGEDTQSINRKHLDFWTGKLPTRFMILTNDLPKIDDTSGALAGRFLILGLTHSFQGREDANLFASLTYDLPGIFLWALVGLDRLLKRGHFVAPPSSQILMQDLEELGSPMRAFVAQQCEIGPGHSCSVDGLFQRWKGWCKANEHEYGTTQSFGRDLRAAVPGLAVTQPRVNGIQVRTYEGIRARPRKGVRCRF